MSELSRGWLETDRFVLYGWGNIGKKCFAKFQTDFHIVAIIDNDYRKQGEYHGIPIIGKNSAHPILESNKVIVLTGGKVYKDIADDLNAMGLQENIDFCSVEVFISEWYWDKKGQNYLLEVHTAITMRCTFKCINCNMFVPYYKKAVDYSFEEMKHMYDLFFQYVDYVFCIALLGGEPFLSPILGELIDYLGNNYSKKIGVINIISNGSVVPDDMTIGVMVRHGVLVYLSNYSSAIPYEKKLMQTIEKLQKNNIEYMLRDINEWKDFGFPMARPVIKCSDMVKHMRTCAPIFHGLNDNKFYYCHVAWSAEKAGIYKLNKGDYICLDNLALTEKRKLTKHALGNLEDGYVSLCQLCGGCGDDNLNIVKAAIQK